MASKESLTVKTCNFISRYSLFALIFLLPIFFLPWTADVLDFNKQSLLVVLVFVSLFALMLKILATSRFEMKKSPMHKVALFAFVAYMLSAVFSAYKYGSFWGASQQVSESILTLGSLFIFYFLATSIFSKKDILTVFKVFSFSAIVAELVGIMQLVGFYLPFDFAKSATFNLIGSAGSMGIFAAITLSLAIFGLIVSKKWWKVLFAVQILFSMALFVLVNYPIIWWIVLIGSVITLILGVMKRDFFSGSWMALPMFFLAISLFFVFLNPQMNWLPQKSNEIFLTQTTGFDIAMSTLKESPIFGSGLGTFGYDFSKFKNPKFSEGTLWNVIFNKSSSEVLGNLATTGVLGFLAVIAFLFFPIFYAAKALIRQKEPSLKDENSQIVSVLLIGLFIALIQEAIVFFVYNSNLTLDFVYFLTVSALAAIIFESKKEYLLKPSSVPTLITTLAFTLIFIAGMGLMIFGGQRYVAEVDYYKALAFYQAGNKTAGLQALVSAAKLNPSSDLYFKQLSQAYLLDLQDELQGIKTAPTDQEKSKVQILLANAVNAAKIATDLNPKDVSNWSTRGYIYQSVSGLYTDAQKWAITSYDSAIKLSPSDSYLRFQEGSVYLLQAINSTSEEQRKKLLSQAKTQLEKAISLTPSYSNALYSLGITYNLLGQNDKAIGVFLQLQQLNPSNKDIPKILANLKAGKSILQVATPPTESPSNAVKTLDKESSQKTK